MKPLKELVRENIYNLKPYSSARSEFKGDASVFIDANENPYDTLYNRYPDPLQLELKEKIAQLKGGEVTPQNIFLGVGSDEPIDLMYRVFCNSATDNVVSIDPSYGMYKVCADINDVEYRTVTLNDHFDIDADKILEATDNNTKVIWLCSPNNPTGNLLSTSQIDKLLEQFGGIVVVDEAYIDFASQPSYITKLSTYPNLVVMQTFSKAWGSAGVRLGLAYASTEIISIFNKVKYPYNINTLTQQYALELLSNSTHIAAMVQEIIKNRQALEESLKKLPIITEIYPSDANFLLVKTVDAIGIYNYLVERGIIVRSRHGITLCNNALRITIGTDKEMQTLVEALSEFKN